jgi:hypothetical protein
MLSSFLSVEVRRAVGWFEHSPWNALRVLHREYIRRGVVKKHIAVRASLVLLATILGPLRHFILAHPKLLILCGEVLGVTLYRNSRRSCGNVGIAQRFPRAVERVENLLLVFRKRPRILSITHKSGTE